jgi:G3E family GTPase
VQQVECSDVIVVNKADLLSAEQTPLLKDIVHALAPRAEILTCSYGDIPLTKALGKHALYILYVNIARHIIHWKHCNALHTSHLLPRICSAVYQIVVVYASAYARE